jgi:hypothetical protein
MVADATDEAELEGNSQQLNPIYKKILINRKIKVDIRDVLAAQTDILPAS